MCANTSIHYLKTAGVNRLVTSEIYTPVMLCEKW